MWEQFLPCARKFVLKPLDTLWRMRYNKNTGCRKQSGTDANETENNDMTDLEVEVQAQQDAQASGLTSLSSPEEMVDVAHKYMDQLPLTEEQQDLYLATFVTYLTFS
jgi:hypothetical protein